MRVPCTRLAAIQRTGRAASSRNLQLHGSAVQPRPRFVTIRSGCYSGALVSTAPKDAIVELIPARNIADLMDTIVVRWGGGGDVQAGNSLIALKSYEQGR
jgi:hypothetical protein